MKPAAKLFAWGAAAFAVTGMGLLGAVLISQWRPTVRRDESEFRLPDKPLSHLYLLSEVPANQGDAGKATHGGLLARELIRQAILIAARDEMGVHTRDETLGDPVAADDPYAVDVSTTHLPNGSVQLDLSLSPTHQSDWTFQQLFSIPREEAEPFPYVAFAETLEEMTRQEFSEALRSARFEGHGIKSATDQKLPPEVETQLARLAILSQLAAVRRLHAMVRDQGASNQVLGGLSRGYANLAMLTYPLWTPRSPAFAARGLLYAQRLLARDSASPLGKWHRAYALAMIGLDAAAISDIEAASANGQGPKEVPPWIPLLLAQCRYDHARVRQLINDTHDESELAQFLLFRALGGEYRAHRSAVEVAREFITSRHADCMPLTHALAQSEDVRDAQLATTSPYTILPGVIQKAIGDIHEIPEEIKFIATQPDPLVLVPQAMVGCRLDADPGVPSSNVIGRILQEIALVRLFDRLRCLHERENAPWRDEYARYSPRVEDHPLSNLVFLAVIDPRRDPQKAKEFFSNVRVPDVRMPVNEFSYKLKGFKPDSIDVGEELWRMGKLHLDDAGTDLRAYASLTNDDETALRRWVAVSPYRPIAHALLLRCSFENERSDLDRLLAEFGKHPEASGLIADVLVSRGLDEQAIEALKADLEWQGDKSRYFQLAGVYRKRGDEEAWRRTLDEYLQGPDDVSNQAEAQVMIANHLMRQGHFEEAFPYAQSAANTYSHGAMVCAAYCAEGLNRWDLAEQIIRNMIDRYPGHGCAWYLWCHRTGQGDIKNAKARAQKFLAALDHQETIGFVRGQMAAVHMLEGDFEAALVDCEKAFKEESRPYQGLMAAVACRMLGRSSEHEQWLDSVIKESQANGAEQKALKVLAEKIRAALSDNGASLTEEIVEQLAESLDDAGRLNVYFFAADHWEAKGDKDRARSYLEKVRDRYFENQWVSALAADRLRKSAER